MKARQNLTPTQSAQNSENILEDREITLLDTEHFELHSKLGLFKLIFLNVVFHRFVRNNNFLYTYR